MIKIYSTFLFCISFIFSDAQGRLVLNGAHHRIANGTAGSPAYLVIDNNNPNAITSDSQISNLRSQLLYYRLKQTDYDGSSSYSGTIAVSNCNENANDNLSFFIGNKEELILTMNSSSEKKYDLFFYDNLGRRIHSEVIHVSKGFNTKILNPKKFATGIYFVTLMNEEEVVAKKVMVH